jgi:hypothetical protein
MGAAIRLKSTCTIKGYTHITVHYHMRVGIALFITIPNRGCARSSGTANGLWTIIMNDGRFTIILSYTGLHYGWLVMNT